MRAQSALLIALAGCAVDPPAGQTLATTSAAATVVPSSAAPSASPARDLVAQGAALVKSHECNRCHDGSGPAAAPREKHCVSCHLDIEQGRFDAAPAVLAAWKPRVAHLKFAPSLSAVGIFVKPAWVERFLLKPHDLRPFLHAEMPRLALDESDAHALAAYFGARAPAPLSPPATLTGDVARGRALFTTKTCVTCHVFTGAGSPAPPNVSHGAATKERALAPDLRFARERLVPEQLASFIADPQSIKPDAAMPKLAVSAQEAADLATFVLSAPLDEAPPPIQPPRLPLLERAVGYDEVAEKLLHKICWHCHSQPDYARGDGGPGNTGGFGFAPRLLDLSSYESIASGYLDARGERRSLFSPGATGDAILLEVLLARQKEAAGRIGESRGMPLGLPAVSPELIQLIETWVANGHPR